MSTRERVATAHSLRYIGILVFLSLHIPLAISMRYYNEVSTIHALATVTVGLCWLALRSSLERAAYVGAYITGAEVLWRMTGAYLFWEFGKYAVAAVLVIALLRAGRLRGPILPILYFLLLLPSGLFTFEKLDFNQARQQFSFNMSGPFLLMLSLLFFSHVRLSIEQIRWIFVAMIGPIVGIATLILLNLYTPATINFSQRSSNFAVTGGFGPNQVAAVLSLGAVAAFLYILCIKSDWPIKSLMFGLAIVFACGSVLTFSRGGIYMASGSIALSSLYLVRDTRSRVKLLILMSLVAVIANYYILPTLDGLTQHAIIGRFENTYDSVRERIILSELRLWKDNLFFGVGPGVSMLLRKAYLHSFMAPHTEFTRLLAEHGMLGLLSFLLLLTMGLISVRHQNTPRSKAFVVAILAWSFLFMTVNGMRMVAPAFLFGLAYVTMNSEGVSPLIATSIARLNVRYVSGGAHPTYAQR